MENTRQLGTAYEAEVAKFLEQKGYRILEKNFRCKMGEIDLIARDGKQLVFVEVKYRSSSSYGTPMEAVNYRKQRKISNVAAFYLYSHHLPMDTSCRFDVVAASSQSMELFRNAFSYVGSFSF